MEISIAGLAERDLDLIFAEECSANSAFRSFLLREAGSPVEAPDSVIAVTRHATHSTGESDLMLDTRFADGTLVRLLIENKVDAAMQREQAARYRTRAISYVADGRCDVCLTLLVAPDRYFGNDDSGFDGEVSYEQIIEEIRSSVIDRHRLAFRLSVIESAIDKATLGYQRRADAAMNTLWEQYRSIAAALAPELNVPDANGRPTGSHFVYFKPDGFPSPIQLIHKFAYGRVDVQFPRWGSAMGLLRQHLSGILPEGCELVRAGKSVALRREVTKVTVSAPPSDREAPIRVGVSASQDLLKWTREHQSLLEGLRTPPSPTA